MDGNFDSRPFRQGPTGRVRRQLNCRVIKLASKKFGLLQYISPPRQTTSARSSSINCRSPKSCARCQTSNVVKDSPVVVLAAHADRFQPGQHGKKSLLTDHGVPIDSGRRAREDRGSLITTFDLVRTIEHEPPTEQLGMISVASDSKRKWIRLILGFHEYAVLSVDSIELSTGQRSLAAGD